jgi:hypothetical protein
VTGRTVEAVSIIAIAAAVLVGGRALLVQVAQFHGLALSVLGVLALLVLYAFRQNFRAGGALARIHATRDAAFLAAIAGAAAFVASPARWSLGATIVALEIGCAVELLSRFAPTSTLP